MSEEASWIQRYWQQVLFSVAVIVAVAKTMVDIQDLKNTVYDPHGDARFITISNCETCRLKCNANLKSNQDNTQRELQNIHSSIAAMQLTIADMPQRISEHLKTMGLLK